MKLADICSKNKRAYPNGKTNALGTDSKSKNIRDLHKGVN
jgi:hypothetical protein